MVIGRTPIRQGSCVLGSSANRMWLVSSFFHISIYFYCISFHFNLIIIQCRMNSLHNFPYDSTAGRIAYIICHPAMRMASYVGYPSGSSVGRIAYITCCPAAERIATAYCLTYEIVLQIWILQSIYYIRPISILLSIFLRNRTSFQPTRFEC